MLDHSAAVCTQKGWAMTTLHVDSVTDFWTAGSEAVDAGTGVARVRG